MGKVRRPLCSRTCCPISSDLPSALPVPPEIVTFRSGEGGLFKSHYSNLRGVLYWKWRAAPPGTIIDLPEDTYTTNLLFNDIIRRGPVSLDDEPIEGVCALAEMSAKYDLDYITFHCHLHMECVHHYFFEQ